MRQKGKSNRDLTQVGGNFNKKFFEINFNSRNTSKIFSEFEFYLERWTQLGEEQQINAFYSCFNDFKNKSKGLEDFEASCIWFFLGWGVYFLLYWIVFSFSPSLDEFSSKYIGVTTDFKSLARMLSKLGSDPKSFSEAENQILGFLMVIMGALSYSFVYVTKRFAMIPFSKNLKAIKEMARTLFNLLNFTQKEVIKQELSQDASNKKYLDLLVE